MADQPGVATGELEAENARYRRVEAVALGIAEADEHRNPRRIVQTTPVYWNRAEAALNALDRLDAARSAGPRSTPAEPSEIVGWSCKRCAHERPGQPLAEAVCPSCAWSIFEPIRAEPAAPEPRVGDLGGVAGEVHGLARSALHPSPSTSPGLEGDGE